MTARRTTGRHGAGIALAVATAAGAAVAGGVAGAGTAAAQPVSLTLTYTCDVPMLGDQPFTARIDADVPESVEVGESSRRFAIDARTTVDADLTPWLDRIGVKSAEGRVDAEIGVSAPEGHSRIGVPLAIARTGIPESGSFDVAASGAAPALTFGRPGHGRITVGDVAVHVVGRKANGEVRGRLDVRCALDDGQNDVVGSFEITGAGTSAGSTTSGTSGAADSGGTSASPSATEGPASTGSSSPGRATGTTANTGQNTGDLVLPAAGTLLAGVVALCLGSRLKNHRRTGDDG
ncbi:DUF6801 domain-containing protein [Streptomyces sp. NPDC002446]